MEINKLENEGILALKVINYYTYYYNASVYYFFFYKQIQALIFVWMFGEVVHSFHFDFAQYRTNFI